MKKILPDKSTVTPLGEGKLPAVAATPSVGVIGSLPFLLPAIVVIMPALAVTFLITRNCVSVM